MISDGVDVVREPKGRSLAQCGRRTGGAAWASLLYAPDGRSHVSKMLVLHKDRRGVNYRRS